VTAGTDPLRPRQSEAYDVMARVQREMGRTGTETWLIFRDTDADRMAERMGEAGVELERMKLGGLIGGYQLPGIFWPRPGRVGGNVERAERMAERLPEMREVLEGEGFTEASWQLAEAVMGRWKEWSGRAGGVPMWPENAGAGWMSARMSAREADGKWLALGVVEGGGTRWDGTGLPEGVWVTGWDRLGERLMERVQRRVGWMTLGMGVLLVVCLGLAFRRWSEVVLGLAALLLAFLLLLTGMRLTGASWNLLNLVAIPLVLGTSVDSMIHIQLALRRSGGDLRRMWKTTGTALVLCAGANMAGFGSLAWSSNAGLASLDVVCAGGVAGVLAVSTLLLPQWWLCWHGAGVGPVPTGPGKPSKLYGAWGWRMGCGLARTLPRGLLVGVARVVAMSYRRMKPERFEVVVGNLLPWVGDDAGRARSKARENFDEFGVKLVDLWRYEAGVEGAGAVEPASGWEAFHAAVGSGRGVLLVTPHLGQWELGGPLLVRMGVRPLVLSAVEPGSDLTGMRAGARSRHGVETLVVGEDPFAFVEVIRRLLDGGVVALLVDRPPAGSGVTVELAGRPFEVSAAAAELARATGCVVLPVYVVREEGRYQAHALPAVEYDRASLGSREARRGFAGRILRVFEPAIRQFPEQWFHFVPMWPADRDGKGGGGNG
jgi:KDO2-lipid IV(A) lauroyltransferase